MARKRSFHTKVVGVTFQNDDGSSRQRILKRCRKGEALMLVHVPIPEDPNAVAVRRASTGEQLGHLPRSLAAEIAPKLRRGDQRYTFPAGVTLEPGNELRVASGPDAKDDPPDILLWTYSNVWNNSQSDPAVLMNGEEVVAEWCC